DPEDVALDRAEPVGGPAFRCRGDPLVEGGRLRGDRLRRLPREVVDFPFVQRRERLSGDVPLVQQEERRPARRAAAAHSTAPAETSTASTSTPHIVVSASATRSCTVRASRGSTTP